MTLPRSVVCASALLASAAAFAGDYQSSAAASDPRVAAAFSQLDIDRDGVISPAEASADSGLARVFPNADADGSGALTPAEFGSVVAAAPNPAARPLASVDEIFERLDTNNDEMIGPQEAKADAAVDRGFEQADRNDTNTLNRGELAELAMRAPGDDVQALFSSYDANRDGSISWAEAQADPELARWFARADRDLDRALTPAEFDGAVDMAAAEHLERMPRG